MPLSHEQIDQRLRFLINQVNYLRRLIEQGGGGTPTLFQVLDVSNDADGLRIRNVGLPDDLNDAVNKQYVDDAVGGITSVTAADLEDLATSGDLITGRIYRVDDADGSAASQQTSRIFIRAISTTKLEHLCACEALTADFEKQGEYGDIGGYTLYDGTDANGGVWTVAKESTLIDGNVIIWNNAHYVVIDDSEFAGTAPDATPSAYSLLGPDEDNGYVREEFTVHYNVGSNSILRKIDKRGNDIRGVDNIRWFPWGDSDITNVQCEDGITFLCMNGEGSISGRAIGEGQINLQRNFGTIFFDFACFDATSIIVCENNSSNELNLHLKGLSIGCYGNNNQGNVTLYMDDMSYASFDNNTGELYGHILNHSTFTASSNAGVHKDFYLYNHGNFAVGGSTDILTHNITCTNQGQMILSNVDGNSFSIERCTLNNITMNISGTTLAASIVDKIAQPGLSTFEVTKSITGLTDVSLTDSPSVHAGIVNLTSTNASETIDTITLSSDNKFPIKLVPEAGLSLTFNATAAGSEAGNDILIYNASTYITNGDVRGFFTVEKFGSNVRQISVPSNYWD